MNTTTTTTTEIHTRAILVNLTIGTWAARKYDKAATAKIISHYGAANDAARVAKALLPYDAASYKTLMQLATSIRAAHYAKTLAWADVGDRLLPTAGYADYTAWYRDVARQFADARMQFGQDYPALRDAAPARLNGMWRAEDYPTTHDVLARFSIGVQFAPVPAAGDIRVDLGADQLATIEASVTSRVQAATDVAMRDAWTRLHDVVSHIAERLSDPKAIFRDSLIDNAKDVCDALQRLNVTNDPQLEIMRARVAAELTAVSASTLRDVPNVRAVTAMRAMDIMSAMAGMYGGQKGGL